jgi:hypothetical protein
MKFLPVVGCGMSRQGCPTEFENAAPPVLSAGNFALRNSPGPQGSRDRCIEIRTSQATPYDKEPNLYSLSARSTVNASPVKSERNSTLFTVHLSDATRNKDTNTNG